MNKIVKWTFSSLFNLAASTASAVLIQGSAGQPIKSDDSSDESNFSEDQELEFLKEAYLDGKPVDEVKNEHRDQQA